MSIALGSTVVDSIYLGEVGYGLSTVIRVYLNNFIVWPAINMSVSQITDSSATALNGYYVRHRPINGKPAYYGPNLAGPVPSNLSGETICVHDGSQWLLGFETATGGQVDTAYYWSAAGSASLLPPTSGWTSSTISGSISVAVYI